MERLKEICFNLIRNRHVNKKIDIPKMEKLLSDALAKMKTINKS